MGSASEFARKWARNLGQATESIKSGVMAVQVSPGEKAARNVDGYLAGVNRAVADGKYQAGLRSFTVDEWRTATLTKGLPRIASGAAAAVGKVEQFLTEFMPHLESGQRMLESMPRGDLEQNLARMTAMARHNAKFKRSR